MTPLKPLENRRVRGVASTRYPLNTVCAHPECDQPAVDPHHCFPRSQIAGDSWFVEVETIGEPEYVHGKGLVSITSDPIPHVTGLCRPHHDDVEEHRAWIRLEEGEFRWYDRAQTTNLGVDYIPDFELLGLLNPQPGSREGKPKRKKFKGEKPRRRATWSIRVPKDAAEDGVEALKVLTEDAARLLGKEGEPPYYVLMAALYYFVSTFTKES